MTSKKDRTGQKYGRLTFTRRTDIRDNRGQLLWELLCECGNICHARGDDVIRGNKTSCGCWKRRTYNHKMSSARYVWKGSYRDCDWELFLTLSQQDCHYCGSPPSRTYNVHTSDRNGKAYKNDLQVKNGNFTYNGLDRVDSTKGHTSDNVVPCCYPCNWMKSDMTRDEFLAHIRKIAAHNSGSL